MTTTDKLKQKILKILQKASSTTFDEEAQSLAAKAKALMDEHRLTMADIYQTEDPMGRTVVLCPYDDMAYVYMASGAAEFFGCTLLVGKYWNESRGRLTRGVVVVGRESARVTCELMIPFWWQQCNKIGRRAHRERNYHSSPAKAVHQTMLGLMHVLMSQAERGEDLVAAEAEISGAKKHRKTKKQELYHEDVELARTVPLNIQVS